MANPTKEQAQKELVKLEAEIIALGKEKNQKDEAVYVARDKALRENERVFQEKHSKIMSQINTLKKFA